MKERLKIILNFGTIAGIAYAVIFAVFYFLGMNPLGNIGLVNTAIIIFAIIQATKKTRENYFEGYITYGQALMVGVLTGFVYASFCGIINYMFLNFLFPDVFATHKDLLLQEMLPGLETMENLLGAEATEKVLEELENMDASSFAFSDFQSKFLSTAIISLITAAFLKKSQPFFDQPSDED